MILPVHAELITQLRQPTVFYSFQDGVDSAQEALSIPVRAIDAIQLSGPVELNSDEVALYCIFGLIHVKATEQDIAEIIRAVFARVSQIERVSQVCMVGIPSNPLDAEAFFRSRLPVPRDENMSIDCATDMDAFRRIVENHIVRSCESYLPRSETLDQAQLALEEAAGMSGRSIEHSRTVPLFRRSS